MWRTHATPVLLRRAQPTALTWAAITALLFVSCSPRPEQPRTPTPRDRITHEMIADMSATTAYEVLTRALRREPNRPLRGGVTSFQLSQEPVVIIDGGRSEIKALQTLPARDIQEIHILGAREGTLLYGTGAVNGVIVITTRR